MFLECLNVYFFSETTSRFCFCLLIHQQIKDEISKKNSVLRILEADGRQIESVTAGLFLKRLKSIFCDFHLFSFMIDATQLHLLSESAKLYLAK